MPIIFNQKPIQNNSSPQNAAKKKEQEEEFEETSSASEEKDTVYVKTFRAKYIDPVMNTLLMASSIMGILSLAFWIAAVSLGYSIVLFLTGSMEPTIPTGSASIVQEVSDPTEIKVGDVLTVERPDEPLPITHRVVGVNEEDDIAAAIEANYEYSFESQNASFLHRLSAGRFGENNSVVNTSPLTEEAVEAGDVSVVTMRGDANNTDDPRYYMITDSNAREYVVHASYVGYGIGLIRDNIWQFLTGVILLIAYSIFPWKNYNQKKREDLSEKELKKLSSQSKDVITLN